MSRTKCHFDQTVFHNPAGSGKKLAIRCAIKLPVFSRHYDTLRGDRDVPVQLLLLLKVGVFLAAAQNCVAMTLGVSTTQPSLWRRVPTGSMTSSSFVPSEPLDFVDRTNKTEPLSVDGTIIFQRQLDLEERKGLSLLLLPLFLHE